MELTQKLTHKHQKIVIDIEVDYSPTETHIPTSIPHTETDIYTKTLVQLRKTDSFPYPHMFAHSLLRHIKTLTQYMHADWYLFTRKDTTHTENLL